MNRQLNRCYLLLFSTLPLLLAACGQDAQPVASAPSFSFDIDLVTASVDLNNSDLLAAQVAGECGAAESRNLTPSDELELSDHTFVFLPGNILKITAAFTNTTDYTLQRFALALI